MMRSRMLSLMAVGVIGVSGAGIAASMEHENDQDRVEDPALLNGEEPAEVPGDGEMQTLSGHIVDLQTFLVHGYDEAIEEQAEDPFEQPLEEEDEAEDPFEEPQEEEWLDDDEAIDQEEEPAELDNGQEEPAELENGQEEPAELGNDMQQDEQLEDPAMAAPEQEQTLALVTEDEEAYVLIRGDHETLGYDQPAEEPAEEPAEDQPVEPRDEPAEDPADDPIEDPAMNGLNGVNGNDVEGEDAIEDPQAVEEQEQELEDPQQVIEERHQFTIGQETDVSGLVYERGGVRGLIIGDYEIQEEAEEPEDPWFN